MIHDAEVAAGETAAVEGDTGDVAGAVADVADDGVARAAEAERPAAEGHAFAWRSLAGDGDVRMGEREARVKRDEAGDVEDDGAGAGFLFDGVADSAGNGSFVRTVIGQRGDFHDAASATADGEATIALGAGEGEVARAELPDGALGDVSIGADFVDTPVVEMVVAQTGEREGACGLVAFEFG
ncbi:MAG: hypothetical protein QM760_00890 [Nibricoccus sp.]